MDSTEKLVEKKNEERAKSADRDLKLWCAEHHHLGKVETLVPAMRIYDFIVGNELKF
jgi:hypothetical protein